MEDETLYVIVGFWQYFPGGDPKIEFDSKFIGNISNVKELALEAVSDMREEDDYSESDLDDVLDNVDEDLLPKHVVLDDLRDVSKLETLINQNDILAMSVALSIYDNARLITLDEWIKEK